MPKQTPIDPNVLPSTPHHKILCMSNWDNTTFVSKQQTGSPSPFIRTTKFCSYMTIQPPLSFRRIQLHKSSLDRQQSSLSSNITSRSTRNSDTLPHFPKETKASCNVHLLALLQPTVQNLERPVAESMHPLRARNLQYLQMGKGW